MGEVLMKEERREFSRIALRRPASLQTSGGTVACELLDISLRGALVHLPEGLGAVVGEPCTLVVRLSHAAVTIRMCGVVAHADAATVGVACRELDLDSVAHLRRLVELNLADDRLLDRELIALASSRRK